MNRKLFVAVALVLSAGALAVGTAPTSATVTCDRFAATTGSDAGAGTSAAPYRTAQKLLDSLTAGQTGCLATGTYTENVRVNHGGQAGSPISLMSSPGGVANVVGRFYVPAGSNDLVVSDLSLDGTNAGNLPSPTIDGDRVTFTRDDVTDRHTGICFSIGAAGWGTAHDTVLDGNRVHDCGRLPYGSTNHDHGIYVESARGTVIKNNYIYDNADRGVQLYPDAQGSTVTNNVIDGNGEGVIFSGESGLASSNNVVSRNVISNALVRYNVESWWPVGNPVGSGNVVSGNCLWNGKQGNVGDQVGFTAGNNIVSNPLYVNRAAKDFTLSAGSPCAGYGPGAAAPPLIPGNPPPPPPPAPVAPSSTATPSISGTARVGSRFTASSGTWIGSGPLTLTYTWQRCDRSGAGCAATGAGGTSYALGAADVGHTLRVVVLAKNATGFAYATSAPSSVVQAKKGGKTASKQSLQHHTMHRAGLLRLAHTLHR
jgi:parallel beta-helix repeat protein